MNDVSTQREGQTHTLPKLDRNAWLVAVVIWLMFCGMMHDFQTVDTMSYASVEEMIDTLDTFERM